MVRRQRHILVVSQELNVLDAVSSKNKEIKYIELVWVNVAFRFCSNFVESDAPIDGHIKEGIGNNKIMLGTEFHEKVAVGYLTRLVISLPQQKSSSKLSSPGRFMPILALKSPRMGL